MYQQAEISELQGLVFSDVTGEVGGEEICFHLPDGSYFKMWHSQDCCESVSVEDICGDLSDLIGWPILSASEETSETMPDERERYEDESRLWTFYRLATIKGYVTIRWYGTSNGYYSVSVGIDKISR